MIFVYGLLHLLDCLEAVVTDVYLVLADAKLLQQVDHDLDVKGFILYYQQSLE